MLIEFSVENFLSFDERVTLSMVAAPELDGADGLLENTFEAPGGIRLLKSTLVYGANASGKSNLVKAVLFVRQLVMGSAKETQAGEPIEVRPFLLGSGREDGGSSFEVIWFDEETRYRYGFSVNASRILAESLFRKRAGEDAEIALFRRDAAGIEVDEAFAEGRGIESKTRPNALFLSVVAQLNGSVSERILTWFREGLALASGVQDEKLLNFTVQLVRGGIWTDEILRLAREADLGITGVSVTEISAEMLPQSLPEDLRTRILARAHGTLKIRHQRFDSSGKPAGDADFDFRDESEGTQKFIALAAPLLDVLDRGTALFFDELDARLHPRLSRAVVSLFHSASNPRNAQLVGATHDTNLLDRSLVRRDQIWFTEKNRRGATKLYSLAEFDLPPGDEGARYERDYLLGKYGAVPVIGELVTPEPAK
jgi:predicted ATPase